jgi:hypothetical protein
MPGLPEGDPKQKPQTLQIDFIKHRFGMETASISLNIAIF